jgi:hypothetical protein
MDPLLQKQCGGRMAQVLLMVMTVCLLVYAVLEYRIRTALKEHDAAFPNQKGQPVQNPTARWVFHYFVGIHELGGWMACAHASYQRSRYYI